LARKFRVIRRRVRWQRADKRTARGQSAWKPDITDVHRTDWTWSQNPIYNPTLRESWSERTHDACSDKIFNENLGLRSFRKYMKNSEELLREHKSSSEQKINSSATHIHLSEVLSSIDLWNACNCFGDFVRCEPQFGRFDACHFEIQITSGNFSFVCRSTKRAFLHIAQLDSWNYEDQQNTRANAQVVECCLAHLK